MIDIYNRKTGIVLGKGIRDNKGFNISVAGYDSLKLKVIIQLLDSNNNNDLKKYSIKKSKKGYYFNYKGKRLYLNTVNL